MTTRIYDRSDRIGHLLYFYIRQKSEAIDEKMAEKCSSYLGIHSWKSRNEKVTLGEIFKTIFESKTSGIYQLPQPFLGTGHSPVLLVLFFFTSSPLLAASVFNFL